MAAPATTGATPVRQQLADLEKRQQALQEESQRVINDNIQHVLKLQYENGRLLSELRALRTQSDHGRFRTAQGSARHSQNEAST